MEKHIWDLNHSTIERGLFNYGIHNKYSFFGYLANISNGFLSHVFHPQFSKISGLFSLNTSQSISITILVLMIPGTSITGEQGPKANALIFSFIESYFFSFKQKLSGSD